ncbi:MAG: D-amino acid aminotransferase [Burkholderiales bacterium]|nr:D-amino acid aminotransferase [Burkholderiales bacterium]
MVYLNGEFLPLEEAKVPVLDRGFIFGDGVYEFVPCYGGKPLRLAQHLARLQRNCEAIRLANPCSDSKWAELIAEIIMRNGGGNLAVYMHLTRGVAKRDHAFPATAIPTVFMMATPLSTPSQEQIDNGVACVTMADNRWLRCDVKSISLLGNVLLRQAAMDGGGVEAVLFRDGFLTEGSASNILVARQGKLLAPPKDHLILPGITYDLVLELDAQHGVPLEVREISEAEVRGADELMLTSSSKEVLAITILDGKPVGNGKPGPIFKLLHQLYQTYKAKLESSDLSTDQPGR